MRPKEAVRQEPYQPILPRPISRYSRQVFIKPSSMATWPSTLQPKLRTYTTRKASASIWHWRNSTNWQQPCDSEILKRAALFSALTGLRHSDIKQLKWRDIVKDKEHYQLHFTQQKTKGVEYMPISDQAYSLCGERGDADRLVFEGLQDPSWINRPVKRWIEASGITKHITFHCFRHTYATLQLTNGTDIYTVSKMLGHKKVTTTQIYAKIVDAKKDAAADAIQITLTDDMIGTPIDPKKE